ncbi:hypothetical protein GCM10009087_12870 [Sphingomonas oligophenolica]|uniref:VOC family protein n=1 Tax=Sphingomonas oligophenolica TaxID=301154 RepID=A0ABU9Y8P6_9SPHN
MSSASPHAAPLAPVLGASHVAIEVANLDRSVEFYRRSLGLRVVVDDRSGPSGPSIKGLIADFAIELTERPGAVASRDFCLSFSVRGIEQIHQAFREAEFGEAGDLTPLDGALFFFIRDPDGNAVELIELPYAATTLGQLLDALARNSSSEN